VVNPIVFEYFFPGELQKMLSDPGFWLIILTMIVALLIEAILKEDA
jgi:hypothetical protein